ncbi:MAG: ribonuclease P protein component [Gemmatimonadota bacterium]
MRARFPRSARIGRSEEIRRLLRRGRRMRHGPLEFFVAPAPCDHPRFGIIVPRYRRKVVARNIVRRRLRELGRLHLLPRLRSATLSFDVLVRARPEAYGASFTDLRAEVERLTDRLCSDASPSH